MIGGDPVMVFGTDLPNPGLSTRALEWAKEAMMAADAQVTDMSDLKDLDPLSKRLNAASDELTKTIESIQRKLNEMALGVEVWLTARQQELGSEAISSWGNGTGRTLRIQELGYGRVGDGWALLVRTLDYLQEYMDGQGWVYADSTEGTPVDRKPLLRASRQIRVRAVDLIPDLVDELQREATAVISAVERAKKIADSLK